MTRPPHSSLVGRRARFRIRDVHYPEPAAVLEALHLGDVLEGEVLDLSDSGLSRDAFAVLKVDALPQPVVVAVRRLLPWTGPRPDGA